MKKRAEIVRQGDVLGLDGRGQIVRPGEVGYNGHLAFVRGTRPAVLRTTPRTKRRK
jgi:hypothetical protein